MLWTDRKLPLTLQDLADLDSQIAAIVAAEQINARRVIDQALQEAATVIQSMMQSSVGVVTTTGITPSHAQAVMNTGSAGLAGIQIARIQLSQIVVTGLAPGVWTHIRSWLGYCALAALLRDACERKDNDRYKVKWDRIEAYISKTAEPLLINNGIPVVGQPLSAPAAGREPDAGDFDAADLSLTADGSAAGGEWDVAVSWTGARYGSPSRRNNAESCPSLPATIKAPAGQAVVVSIARLHPPTSVLHEAYAAVLGSYTPLAATGWNLWMGPHGQQLTLQNPAGPLPLLPAQLVLTGDPVVGRYRAHEGQFAEVQLQVQRVFFRG